jgi:carbon storage regulator
MLVLSRKAGESLSIGPDITLEIISVEGDRVRIGIQAPKEIRIYRSELLQQTIDINKSAVNTPLVSFPKITEEKV